MLISERDRQTLVSDRGSGAAVPVPGAPAAGGHGRGEGQAGHHVGTQLSHRGKSACLAQQGVFKPFLVSQTSPFLVENLERPFRKHHWAS